MGAGGEGERGPDWFAPQRSQILRLAGSRIYLNWITRPDVSGTGILFYLFIKFIYLFFPRNPLDKLKTRLVVEGGRILMLGFVKMGFFWFVFLAFLLDSGASAHFFHVTQC